MMNEHAELGVRLVDIEPGSEAPAERLARELLAPECGEEEVMLTARGRFVSRMVPAALDDLRASATQPAVPSSGAVVAAM